MLNVHPSIHPKTCLIILRECEWRGAAKIPAHRSASFTGVPLTARSRSDDLPLRSRSTWFFEPRSQLRSYHFDFFTLSAARPNLSGGGGWVRVSHLATNEALHYTRWFFSFYSNHTLWCQVQVEPACQRILRVWSADESARCAAAVRLSAAWRRSFPDRRSSCPQLSHFLYVFHGLDGAREGCMESSGEGCWQLCRHSLAYVDIHVGFRGNDSTIGDVVDVWRRISQWVRHFDSSSEVRRLSSASISLRFFPSSLWHGPLLVALAPAWSSLSFIGESG